MTIAVDLVVTGVTEPVRFIVETKAKIFPTGEKFFWSPSKPKFHETFVMELKEVRTKFPLDYKGRQLGLYSTEDHKKDRK